MAEKKAAKIRRETLVEKLVRRSLETVGGSVDSVFGRGKKPDALPATSDLANRLRKMIDRQAQVNKDGRKLAPHLISLKYAWGQTSDEFQVALKRLKNELLIVTIDFVNDNRYATLAPVKIEAKADILTTGFTMSIGFDEASLREAEAVDIPVEIYAKLLPDYQTDLPPVPTEIAMSTVATFPSGGRRSAELHFVPQKRTTLTVGRIKETDLYLDDESVSKHHASLVMSAEGVLRVADIGSTNGTFLNDARIAYGKAYEIEPETIVRFGDVTVKFAWEIPQPEPAPEQSESDTLSDLSENVPTAAIDEGIKIGVRSAMTQNLSTDDEPATIFGAKSNDEDYLTEPETVNRSLGKEEPETVNKQIEIEPETLNKQVSVETLKTINDEPKTTSLAGLETSPNQLSETRKLSDFTQSLETNALDQNSTDDDLQGFDSLLGKSNSIVERETNELIEDAEESSDKR